MTTSLARVEANRLNSLKSTGPRTEAGKARSRRNSCKHGLTGEGVVMDDATASEVEARRARILDEVGPRTEVGAILVERIAVLSVRLERATRFDEEATLGRVRHALDDFDDARTVEVESLYRRLAALADLGSADECPADATPTLLVRKLGRSAEGVDRLILGLRQVVARLGRGGEDLDAVRRSSRLVDLIDGQAPWLREEDAETGSLAEAVRHRAEGAIKRLELSWHAVDHALRAADRRGAPDLALFDASVAGELARRYEARAERALFRAIDALRLAEPGVDLEPREGPPASAAPVPPRNPSKDRPAVPRPHLSVAEPGGASTIDVSAGRGDLDPSAGRPDADPGVDHLPELPSWFVPEPGMDVDQIRRVYAEVLAEELARLDQGASA